MKLCFSVIFVLAVSPAYAQSDQIVERVIPLGHVERPQAIQELGNAVRVMAELSTGVAVEETQKALKLRGAAERVGLGEWLIHQLDRPERGPAGASQEYTVPWSRDTVVRVFYLDQSATPRGAQEILNAIRTIAEATRLAVFNQERALVVRGTTGQLAASQWLIEALDKPAPANQTPEAAEYRLLDAYAPVARVFYLNPTISPQSMQELFNRVRMAAQITRIAVCATRKALVVRGTEDAVSVAQRTIREAQEQ